MSDGYWVLGDRGVGYKHPKQKFFWAVMVEMQICIQPSVGQLSRLPLPWIIHARLQVTRKVTGLLGQYDLTLEIPLSLGLCLQPILEKSDPLDFSG